MSVHTNIVRYRTKYFCLKLHSYSLSLNSQVERILYCLHCTGILALFIDYLIVVKAEVEVTERLVVKVALAFR